MVGFLIARPIAVTMTFMAILVLGLFASARLPISLLPNADIPRVVVQVTSKGLSARELENSVVQPLRRHLLQTEHLVDVRSDTRDGSSLLELEFEFGSDIDLVFIELNEKIDRAVQELPKVIERPKAIKASATDIPALYINLTLRDQEASRGDSALYPVPQSFVTLSDFAFQVIRKRIEQLPEVAMVDMSGMVFPELLIIPNQQKFDALNISIDVLEEAVAANNLNLGNLTVQDGQYQYNVRFSSLLRTKNDLEEIYLKVNNRLFQLKDLATVVEHPQPRSGFVSSDGKTALSMAIIKRGDAQMGALKEALTKIVEDLEREHPHIHFTVTKDQSALLEYSIDNLFQSLFWSIILAFLVMLFFLKDFQSPILIGITIPISLVVSLLFFYLLDLSVNIISLSGLVLGVGLMVDNSIVVIDNIGQHRNMGKDLRMAAIAGVNEVFKPLLSSVLTTCAVFIPLIFLSGISGTLFYDQAMAVSIGLISAFVISVTLLPVYYNLFYGSKNFVLSKAGRKSNYWTYKIWYDKGLIWVLRHQIFSWCIISALPFASILLYYGLPISRLPAFTQNELSIAINWNTPVTLQENYRRVDQLIYKIKDDIDQRTSFIGKQNFLLDKSSEIETSESVVYLRVREADSLQSAKQHLIDWISHNYPEAVFEFRNPGNIFDLLVADREPVIEARLRALGNYGDQYGFFLNNTLLQLKESCPQYIFPDIEWQQEFVLEADPARLATYEVSSSEIYRYLKSAFSENEILLIADNQYFIPVVVGRDRKSLPDIISSVTVPNKHGDQVYLRSLVTLKTRSTLKSITSGKDGEYYALPFYEIPEKGVAEFESKFSKVLTAGNLFEANFRGSYYNSRRLVWDLGIILGISILLLYFILASQFESLLLPLIVLFEIPIDIFGSLFMLWLFGSSINLMSMIGIIVMSGIIINDSILKIDTINQLRRQGTALVPALHIAGRRRLKPILMTSLTTILALIPFLFTSGMGADLQRPLSLSIIGGMLVGTVVSIYVIPLLYFYFERKK